MNTFSNEEKPSQGLGNRALLDKVDKLRELSISHLVPLPEMVVVGDQSVGKSSVLESLTGFQFPRSSTLCTRHATEIVCRRELTESVVVSIIPHNPTPEREKLIREFRQSTNKITTDVFIRGFEEAAKVIGIKMSEKGDNRGSAFSLDILKVEINHPNPDHLTIIDVPGMFETVTLGVTEESDIDLVKDMVKRYIFQSRTIILAVVPCNGDIANQKILRLAAEADPKGKRTLGVLTKPDLAIENSTKAAVCDLINGKRRDLHLGYCVVKNLGADDTSSTMDDRHHQEQALFGDSPWNTLPAHRLGIQALRVRIGQLLMDRTRAEFPLVKNEIMASLNQNQELLKELGDPRVTKDQQRAYVGKVASSFMGLKHCGLDAYYCRDDFFKDLEMRLITRIRAINEAFANVMYDKDHAREFHQDNKSNTKRRAAYEDDDSDSDSDTTDDTDDSDADSCMSIDSEETNRTSMYDDKLHFVIPTLCEKELSGILSDPYWCPEPETDDMLHHIQEQYLQSRGYEIGTFNSEMVPCAFKEQGSKWRSMALAHTSNAILIVHHFIRHALESCCPDDAVRDALWNFLLYGHDSHDGLLKRYARAMSHAELLLSIEFSDNTITYDRRFEAKLNELKQRKLAPQGPRRHTKSSVVTVKTPSQNPKSSLEEIANSIHDALKAYYDIALSRFVDVVCQQVIDHHLLHSKDGPLGVLSDRVALSMSADQLNLITAEDQAVKEKRGRLSKEIEALSQALQILRS